MSGPPDEVDHLSVDVVGARPCLQPHPDPPLSKGRVGVGSKKSPAQTTVALRLIGCHGVTGSTSSHLTSSNLFVSLNEPAVNL